MNNQINNQTNGDPITQNDSANVSQDTAQNAQQNAENRDNYSKHDKKHDKHGKKHFDVSVSDEGATDVEVIAAPAEPTADEILAQEREKYLRLAAEYDNYRKRSAAERASFHAEVKAATIKELLPVFDSLELALKAECSDAAFKQGLANTMKQLTTIFEKLGVTVIPADTGATFDPELHEAVVHIEDDAFPPNSVAEELRKGFRLGDKVIRFSMVKAAN